MDWNAVSKCKHEHLYEDYSAHGGCGTPLCDGWSEYHCRGCGAFIAECPCGYNNGMSGWPYRRVLKKENKR